MEAHFLENLDIHLRHKVDVLTVCGTSKAAQETLDRLRSAGVGDTGQALYVEKSPSAGFGSETDVFG
jgi:hypothetical protein